MLKRDLNYWADLIRRRWRLAAQAGACVFAIVALGTFMWPPVYQSTGEIMVRDNRAELLVSPGLQENAPENPAAVANPINEQDLNSERELLTSLYLVKLALADLPVPSSYTGPGALILAAIRGVVRLPVDGYGALHDIPRLAPRDSWALDVSRHVYASVIKRSNIIEVDYRAHDRQWTRDFLERLLTRYMEFHARISHDPQAQRFFEEQTKLLKAKLAKSSEELRSFQVRTGIGSLVEQKQTLIARISGLQTDEAKTVAELSAAEQESSTLNDQLQGTPRQIDKETKSVQNASLQQLKPQVAQLEAERAELLSRYQPTSERIKEIDAKLEAARGILNKENHLDVQEKSVDLNPVWVSVATNLKQARTSSAALKATQQTVASQLDDGRKQLEQLVNNGVELERLQREVNSDQDTYLSYVRKTEEARAAEALNRDKILNVSVAQPPAVPGEPIFPNVGLNLAIGALLALTLALAAAYWAELTDPRIYSAFTITQASGLPTVAVVTDGR